MKTLFAFLSLYYCTTFVLQQGLPGPHLVLAKEALEQELDIRFSEESEEKNVEEKVQSKKKWRNKAHHRASSARRRRRGARKAIAEATDEHQQKTKGGRQLQHGTTSTWGPPNHHPPVTASWSGGQQQQWGQQQWQQPFNPWDNKNKGGWNRGGNSKYRGSGGKSSSKNKGSNGGGNWSPWQPNNSWWGQAPHKGGNVLIRNDATKLCIQWTPLPVHAAIACVPGSIAQQFKIIPPYNVVGANYVGAFRIQRAADPTTCI